MHIYIRNIIHTRAHTHINTRARTQTHIGKADLLVCVGCLDMEWFMMHLPCGQMGTDQG
jgi:hypothetical protein